MYNFPQENPSQVIFRSLLVKEFQGGGERLQIANQVTQIFPLIFLPQPRSQGFFPILSAGREIDCKTVVFGRREAP